MVWSAVHLRKGVFHEANNMKSLRVLQNQAQGASWHAEASSLMVNDGQQGPVSGASEGFEGGWTAWELIALW